VRHSRSTGEGADAEERKENQQRAALIEIHREAQEFFRASTGIDGGGRAASAYLKTGGPERGNDCAIRDGFAPDGGDVLLRATETEVRGKKLLVESGVISRDQSGARLFDLLPQRITFPIGHEIGKIVASAAARSATTCRNI